jgi:FKBP-type peptidyl-prolyl cis-trans isomerase
VSREAEGPPTLPPGLAAERTASGLEYIDVTPGEGAPAGPGKPVRVGYRVWLLDGTLAGGTGGGAPDRFVPGEATVIPALEEGVQGMRRGGSRRLIVPSDLAYGPQGDGKRIPPYATLIVDLTLLSAG